MTFVVLILPCSSVEEKAVSYLQPEHVTVLKTRITSQLPLMLEKCRPAILIFPYEVLNQPVAYKSTLEWMVSQASNRSLKIILTSSENPDLNPIEVGSWGVNEVILGLKEPYQLLNVVNQIVRDNQNEGKVDYESDWIRSAPVRVKTNAKVEEIGDQVYLFRTEEENSEELSLRNREEGRAPWRIHMNLEKGNAVRWQKENEKNQWVYQEQNGSKWLFSGDEPRLDSNGKNWLLESDSPQLCKVDSEGEVQPLVEMSEKGLMVFSEEGADGQIVRIDTPGSESSGDGSDDEKQEQVDIDSQDRDRRGYELDTSADEVLGDVSFQSNYQKPIWERARDFVDQVKSRVLGFARKWFR